MNVNKYCRENFIPEPYLYCNSILNKIDRLITENDCSFEEVWGWVNRNLINIFGVFIDKRLITEDEFYTLKHKLIEIGDFADKKYQCTPKISTAFKLIMNKAEWYRIEVISNPDEFFKGLNFEDLDWYDDPFESKWYINITDDKLEWKTMVEIKKRTLDELLDLLYILNRKMEEYDLDREELYVVGGFVCLNYKYKILSEDVDSYTKHDIHNIRRLAYDIGNQYDAFGWFSNLNSFSDRGRAPNIEEYFKIDDSFIEYLSLSKLVIYIQSPACLLYTKLCTFRKKDIKDIKAILEKNNLHTKEDTLNFINDYFSINFKSKDEIINNIDKVLNCDLLEEIDD